MLRASQRGDLPAKRAGGGAGTSGYNFTQRVRRVLARSREEAARLRHEYVATEHILLGLVRDDDGVATSALAAIGIPADRVAALVEQKVRPGTASGRETDLPYTARAKKVLELAMSEARLVDQMYHVGTEHLLLGLLREEQGIGAQVLMELGATTERVRLEIRRILGPEEAPADTRVPTPAPAPAAPVRAAGHDWLTATGGARTIETAIAGPAFSPRSSTALQLARDEAVRLGHGQIHPEHLLLGLLLQRDGMAAQLLDRLGVPRATATVTLEESLQATEVPSRDPNATTGHPLTPGAVAALAGALAESTAEGHRQVGTHHLLLAVLRAIPRSMPEPLTSSVVRREYESIRG